MRDRLHLDPPKVARLLVWVALSGLLVWWLRRGSEIVAIYSYYRIRRSVPYIWSKFYEDLPEVGNATALDALYWICIASMIAGVLALLWLALEPDELEPRTAASDAFVPEAPDGIVPEAETG